MTGTLDPLVCDLVVWIAKDPRPYVDVLEAWRTSCPRLTVWEDALDRGYIERTMLAGKPCMIATEAGRDFLRSHGRNVGPVKPTWPVASAGRPVLRPVRARPCCPA